MNYYFGEKEDNSIYNPFYSEDAINEMPSEKRQQLEHILEEIRDFGSVYMTNECQPIPEEYVEIYVGPRGIYAASEYTEDPFLCRFDFYGWNWAFTKEELSTTD